MYGLTAEKDKVKRFLLGGDIPVLVFALIYVPAPLFTIAQHKLPYKGHKLNETYNKPIDRICVYFNVFNEHSNPLLAATLLV